jgi:ribosome modulation factor
VRDFCRKRKKQDSRAWKEGYQSGATASHTSCPYPAGSLKS